MNKSYRLLWSDITRTSSLSDLAGRNYVNSWNDAMILWP